MLQFLRVGLHDLHGRAERVRHEHHRKARLRTQGRGIAAPSHSLPVDLDRVVCRAAARGRHVADEAGKAQAPRIDAVLRAVVVAKKLVHDLRDAVDRLRALDRVLRRRIPGRLRPEGPDGAGRQDRELHLAREFKEPDDPVDAHAPSGERLCLDRCRENRREVDHGVDPMPLHDALQGLGVHQVHRLGRPVGQMRGQRRPPARAGHDRVAALTHVGDEFGADLTGRADDEDAFHEASGMRVREGRPGRADASVHLSGRGSK